MGIDIDKPDAKDATESIDTFAESTVENATDAPEVIIETPEDPNAKVALNGVAKSQRETVNKTVSATMNTDNTDKDSESIKEAPAMAVDTKSETIPKKNGTPPIVKVDTIADAAEALDTVLDEADATGYTKASVFANTKENPNRLKPGGDWPPPIFFDSLNASDQERFYLEHRWHAQWSYYDQKASEAKKLYQRLQLIIGIGSVTVPVLVGLNASNDVARNTLQLITVAISLCVAAAAAIENVKTYGDNWRTFRGAAEELNREKALYDAHTGPYRRSKNRFLLFVERCEDVIAKQNGAWIALKEEQKDRDDDGDGDSTSSDGFGTINTSDAGANTLG